MIKKLKNVLISLVVMLGVLGIATATVAPSYAAIDPQQEACAGTGGSGGAGGCSGNSTQADLTKIIKTIVNILLFVIGAVAVIVIIVGALRYVTSAGDASKVTQAKNTILYAVVGLVVAFLAFAIVNFVIKSL